MNIFPETVKKKKQTYPELVRPQVKYVTVSWNKYLKCIYRLEAF